MAWLIRYEAVPHWFRRASLSYRDVLSAGPVIMDSWMRILFDGQQIGYSHTRVDTQDRAPLEPYLVQNRTVLDLNIMGQLQSVSLYGEAALDPLYNLQRFLFSITANRYAARIEGRRTGRSTFAGRVWSERAAHRFVAEVPEDVVLYSPMMDLVLGRLVPGESVTLKTFDPVSFSVSEVTVRALRHETLRVGQTETNALLLEVGMRGALFRIWVDADGRLLKQETPMGWTLEACTAEEAVQFTPRGSAPDILRTVAIPVEGRVRDARRARLLHVRFSGWPADPLPLRNTRQKIVFQERDILELALSESAVPDRIISDGADPRDLESTLFVQADDGDIRKRAHAIRGSLTNQVDIVLAINRWIHENVAKVPTVSLPSAVDVLRRMEGDCNEHTYLFVALARALGIPARIRIGMIYEDDAFFYHAWPAVWTGRDWWELDPTLGQDAVDATHIGLLDGELSEQLKLMSIIGRTKARILKEES